VAAAALTYVWIETEAGLRAVAGEWDGLLARMDRPSPFLCWEWIFTWWRHFGHAHDLRILTARRGGELVGVAPLHLVTRRALGCVPVRSLELLGYQGSAVCADHLDFLCEPGDAVGVVTGLLTEALRRQDWDVLVLADLAEESAARTAWPALEPHRRWRQLADALSRAGIARRQSKSGLRATNGSDPGKKWPCHTAVVAAETCYFLPLPAEAGALWGEIKRHHPKLAGNVKYYGKRLRQGHAVRFQPEVPAAERDATVAALARLHGLARGRKGETGNFGRESYRRFHQALVERFAAAGKLYLARLDCDGGTVAVLYGFWQGGVLYYYQSGFDTGWSAFGIGTLLLAWVLEDAITRLGAREFDFLRGAEEYKTRWASQARHTVTAYGWQRGWRARLSRWEWGMRRRLAPARAWSGRQWLRWRGRGAPT